MLPQAHHQHYQELKQALEQLRVHVAQAKPKEPDLITAFSQVKNFFQRQVINLSPDELAPEAENKVRSYQTEIHKQLRLLGTDLTFLQAAQQASTVEQRRTQISSRLQTLIHYCEVLLQDN